jgi:hypothetical protein
MKFAMRQARPTLRTVMVPAAPPGSVTPRPTDTAQKSASDSPGGGGGGGSKRAGRDRVGGGGYGLSPNAI